ncbi:unnamed protein product [marine sediment metagenome]|uniref:Uncharacterized protein n=1 Tax=marine sediment metagenome TaxID=412755 RepID=X1GMZ1_9ZZZZ
MKIKYTGSIKEDTGTVLKNTSPYSKIFAPKNLTLENGYAAIVARKSTRVAVEPAMSRLFNVQCNGRPEKVRPKFSMLILLGIFAAGLAAGFIEARTSQVKGISANRNTIIKGI